jgi:hypothetical protein
VPRDRLWGRAALLLGGGAMAVGERLRAEPGLERLLVAPAGDHQPLLPVVGGLQQLEPLEAVGVVDGPGSGREPLSQLVAGLLRHRDRIDLNDGHDSMLPTSHYDALPGRDVLGCLNDGTACDIAAVAFQLTVSALQDELNRSRRRDPVGVPVDDAPANGFSFEDRRHAKVEVVALIRTSELLALVVLDLHRVCEVCGDDRADPFERK